MQNAICFLVNNNIFYYEQMFDLTTLLLKYSCSNCKNGFKHYCILPHRNLFYFNVARNGFASQKYINAWKKYASSGSILIRFKAKL